VGELAFARRHTAKPVKVPLPGPYLLTRAMWVPEVTRAAYASKEELADDVVALLRAEVVELAAAGAEFIQFDEPVLTELVFAPGHTRTFMCAALALRGDPAEELEFAVSLLNRVLEALKPAGRAPGRRGPRTGLHVCRGNWSRDERVALAGDYRPLLPLLASVAVGTLFLELSTPRAGELEVLRDLPADRRVAVGVVNQKRERVETVEEILALARRAIGLFGPERVLLTPDCGFATFADSPVASAPVAQDKLRAIAAAAAVLRRG
jgi:5-methyltetrahydropteroyltriglutamate--homocysteine methyltransferase